MPTVHKVKFPKAGVQANAPNQGRTEANREIYGSSRWKKTSKDHLRKHPFCIRCAAIGKQTLATVTDHIVPINQNGEPWNSDNHQGLCLKCHQKKSARERHLAKQP
jgi:5-methylcytosine-specific restriction protein A